MSCECGVGESTDTCCGPFIKGERNPETAVQLMQSRYTAYATGQIDYILESHAPESRDEVDREGSEQWSSQADWLGLEVAATEGGSESDEKGTVEFIAKYAINGSEFRHHEVAEFAKFDGKWLYVDGEMVKSKPVKRDGPKVGRNEPCPCDSGKKYKRCCGR